VALALDFGADPVRKRKITVCRKMAKIGCFCLKTGNFEEKTAYFCQILVFFELWKMGENEPNLAALRGR
jgi:hypothetical protein